jgi:hypothetical protein
VRYGYANDLEEEREKMRYDLYYIKNQSLWLDAHILLSTVLVVLGGEGASRVSPQRSRRSARTSTATGVPAGDRTPPSWLIRPAATGPSMGRVVRRAS